MGANLASEVRVEEEVSTVRRISTTTLTVGAMAGIAERGPIGSQTLTTSFAEWAKVYGGYTADNLAAVASVQAFFDNGGAALRFTRIVHLTTAGDPTSKTSAQAEITLSTDAGAATPGSVTSATQPYLLAPGDTLIVAIDGGSNQTATVAATAAARTAGADGPYLLSNGMTLQISINGGPTRTKTFVTGEFVSIGAATPAEVISSLNSFLAANDMGAVASVQGSAFKITSNRLGLGSGVNVVGGTANAVFTFTTGNQAGGGNVSNVLAVTAAEVAAMLTAIPLVGGTAEAVDGAVYVESATTGDTSSVLVVAASTADDELGFDNALHYGDDGDAVDIFRVLGKTDGEYAHELSVRVSAPSSGDAGYFNFAVVRGGIVREPFVNLSKDPTNPRYALTILNGSAGSDLIALEDLAPSETGIPSLGTFGPLTGGDDGLAGLTDTDYIGGTAIVNNETVRAGLRVFDTVDIDILAVPGVATSAVQNGMLTYAEINKKGQLFCLLDPPAGYSAIRIVEYVETTAALLELSDRGAIYWPRIKVVNPSTDTYGAAPAVVVPPSGHVMGICARNDGRKIAGQFTPPAGVENGIPFGVLGLETDEVFDKAKRDLVFPKLINPISMESGTPIFVDGSRTLKSGSAWPTVGQRRGVIFVEKRLTAGLVFARHKNINDRLYREVERTVAAFLGALTTNGAFASTNPAKAFFVDVGAALNPPSVQAQRMVVVRIGLATSAPAEYVVLLVGPDTRAIDEELAALAA